MNPLIFMLILLGFILVVLVCIPPAKRASDKWNAIFDDEIEKNKEL